MTVRDRGLQPERTLLAWRRTALGLLANAVLLAAARPHSTHGSVLRFVLGVVMVVLALGFWATVSAAYRGTIKPGSLSSVVSIRLVTGLVVAVGLTDLYVVLTH
ncbi:MAG TPA: DUF202 domain-containing protein [Kribbellaceae bacterium]|jgi:uncharacterized membrane protein YidH (DUF202 family)